MPTYTRPPAPASPRELPYRRAGKTFVADYQRSHQHMTKPELREMLAQAFKNTAKMRPLKKDGEP
jgi:hypothetical protein